MSLLRLYFGEGGCFAAVLVLLFVFGMDSKLYILRRHILSLVICLKIDLLYGCRTKIQKVKNNDRHADNHPNHSVGIFRRLPFMVHNISETQRANHL